MYLFLISTIGYSCEIICVLGVINLGGITSAGTISCGTVTGTLVGAMVGTLPGTTGVWVFSGCMVLNMFAYLFMACNDLSPIVKGVCGPGFLIRWISSLAALVACSVADNPGMTMCCGKNSITYACLSALVLGV